MELILKEDVPGLGFRDDIVHVKNGYGRNYLIPKKIAVIATSSSKKVLAENIRQRAYKEKKNVEDAEQKGKEILQLEIKIKAKVASGDKLFGSVGPADLLEAFKIQGVELDSNSIFLPGRNIKRIGNYTAKIRLHREVSVDFPFDVISEKDRKVT